MSQQINLMIVRPPGPRFSAGVGALMLLVLLSAMLGYGLLQQHNTSLLQQRVEQGERQLEALRQDRQGRQAELGARQARRAALAAADKGRRQLGEGLQQRLVGGEFGSADGYFRHLEILTQIPGAGVWLNSIAITRAGKAMSLEGQAVDREAVLAYVKVLNQRFAVLNVRFEALELNAMVTGAEAGGDAPVMFKLQ